MAVVAVELVLVPLVQVVPTVLALPSMVLGSNYRRGPAVLRRRPPVSGAAAGTSASAGGGDVYEAVCAYDGSVPSAKSRSLV